MPASDAQSALIASSPRSRASSSSPRIIPSSSPRRRWTGSTPTAVTPAIGTTAPGTARRSVNRPDVPTIAPSYVVTRVRSGSSRAAQGVISSSCGSPWNASMRASMNARVSAGSLSEWAELP